MLDGLSVHAIRGERASYQPVKSVLCNKPDPLAIARAFRDRLGLHEVYVADLNAIQGLGRSLHRRVIAELSESEKMDVMLDAGISDIRQAQDFMDHGIRKVVIGSETLRSRNAVRDFPANIDPARITFSLDFHSGKILSQCPDLAALSPIDLLKHLQEAGWIEVILLDLSRVGTGRGADYAMAAEVRKNLPGLQLLIGGGVADAKELMELKSAGVAGVLAATALHQGMIGPNSISELEAK